MKKPARHRLQVAEYVDGILKQDRVIFSQAITVIESQLASDETLAQAILTQILPYAGKSIRVGITGVPGVGKSTFIESLGKHITSQSKKLAVLAIDPSSQRSKGSILGDKTRMETLTNDPLAYIRPTPSQSSLGGVARKTRETMLICEAAGFEVIFIETVGVGQSETVVHGMVDFFLLLMLAGAGDELQGIKKGIMEMADGIAINKADGANKQKAQMAKVEYENALHLFPPAETGWFPKVLTCSSVQDEGIMDIWHLIEEHQNWMKSSGFWKQKRENQNAAWMHDTIKQMLEENFYQHPKVKAQLAQIEAAVKNGEMPPLGGALHLLGVFSDDK
jgi:LAO/AO transport system kinase